MEDVKKHIEQKISEYETQLTQMSTGIKARQGLAGRISEKIRTIKKSRYVIAKANMSTKIIDGVHREEVERFQENDAILANLKNYRTETHLSLISYKKALEQFK